jgi:hypothetical protein
MSDPQTQTPAAPRDQTPVAVNLDEERMYRANDADTSATTVGPGPAVVPKWVAEEWGVEYKAAPAGGTKDLPRAEGSPESKPGAEGSTPKAGSRDKPEQSR